MEGRMIDIGIVVIYLILSFAFGILATRILGVGRKKEEDYFLAGRKVPGWLAGTSVGVTSMNADVAPFYAGMAIAVGVPMVWFYSSRFALGLMIAAIIFCYRWRKLGIQTGPEFYALRFGGRGSSFVRVWQSLYGVLLGMTPWIGAGLLGVHTIFAPIFGYDSRTLTLVIIVPVLLLYVWIAGYSGVLITDFIQSLIIVGANVAVMFMVLYHFGGPSNLALSITEAMGDKAPEILSSFPAPGHAVLGPLAIACWFLVATVGFGGNMQTEGQRVFSCKDSKESMKSFVWSEIVLFVMLLTLTIPILGLLPTHPDLYTAAASERERAYGMLLAEFLPVGVLGLALAALGAAVMSTISSHLNYGAQTLLNDITRTFKPDLGERQGMILARIYMIIIMVIAVGIGYYARSLMDIAVRLLGLFGASLSFAWGQWWWWRTNFPAWVAAVVVGPFIYLGLGPLLGSLEWWQAYAEQGPAARDVLNVIQAAAGAIVSTVTWVIVAFLTKPEDMEVLKKFYLRAKPMGIWGPVRRAIERERGTPLPAKRPMILPGFGVAVLGAAWIVLALLAISQAFVGGWGEAVLMAVLSVVIALAFKFAFNWYYHRLEATEAE